MSAAQRLILAVLLLPANAWAQRFELSGVVTVMRGDHRVDAGLGVERASGVLVGGATRLRHRGIALTLSGETGHLTAVRGSGGIDRDLAQLGAAAQFAPLPWLVLESGVTLRSFGTVVARQRWTLVRAGAEARIPLSGETVWAVGHAHLLPLAARAAYVGVIFQEVAEDSFFIGGESRTNFVRIWIDHIARAFPSPDRHDRLYSEGESGDQSCGLGNFT